MGRRTKRIEIRLTQEEAEAIRKNASGYSSLGHYIRCAVSEYSNIHAREQLRLMNTLGDYYRDYQNQLSWAGSNLNQSVKRANELAVAGLLTPAYIRDVLMPVVSATQDSINSLKSELEKLTKQALRFQGSGKPRNQGN